MANEKTPVVWDDAAKKHGPLGTGEKMGGLDASSMLSSDAGNLLQSGSDGLAYLSGSGMVDPRADNLLEESDQGKLQVTIDRIAEWLDGHPQDAAALADAMNVVSADAGNIIVQGTDKGAYLSNAQLAAAFAGLTDAQKAAIAAAVAEKMAAQLADGKTIVASNGKLTSDPTNATVAQKKAINQALADADSGLVVNNSTGKLQVDFSNMPTDKFEELLAGLKMLVPLEANLSLHVDSTSDGDSIVSGRGTAAKPFKHIQACIDYATQKYSLGTHYVYVIVHPGYYDERIYLRDYATSGGGCVLTASDTSNKPVIRYTGSSGHYTSLDCGNSTWTVEYFKIVNNPVDSGQSPSSGQLFPYIVTTKENGRVVIRSCDCEFECLDSGDNSRLYMIMFSGNITFSPGMSATTLRYHKGTAGSLVVLNADGANISIAGTFNNDLVVDVPCQGDCTVFASATHNGFLGARGAGSRFITFVVASGQTCTGKRHSVGTGSGMTNNRGNDYPGDVAGTVQSETYSWYY